MIKYALTLGLQYTALIKSHSHNNYKIDSQVVSVFEDLACLTAAETLEKEQTPSSAPWNVTTPGG